MTDSGPGGGRRLRLAAIGAVVFVVASLAWLAMPGGRSRTGVPADGVSVSAAATSGAAKGQILNGSNGDPVAGASIGIDGVEAVTDAEGRFALSGIPHGRELIVRMPGYERLRVLPTDDRLTLRLKPQVVKAAYLTYYGIHDREIRTRVLDMVESTELNGLVIDVKGDRGLIPYPTTVPLALEAGAQGPVRIRDMSRLLADIKGRRIYTIARIVVFKDTVLAHHRPDLAVIDARTGQPWIDREGLAWVDPFREEAWDYAIAIAKEAAEKGFDEIQFDYARFPTDGPIAAARYARPSTQQTRLGAINGFFARARRELWPTGVFLAADVFGYAAFNTTDTDVGQRLEDLAPHLDFISLMAYPSGYHLGIPGYRMPVAYPYEIVRESVKLARERTARYPVKIRPWIQDFRDYAFDRRPFGVQEVQAQMRGAEDGGAAGWMLWNPMNRYTAEALRFDPEAFIRQAPATPAPRPAPDPQ
jgi:hypothetical protein